jgi:hypothetical protein
MKHSILKFNEFINESKSNTLKLYHASPKKFTKFNKSKLGDNMGKTPSNMKGFFFSDNIKVAESFGEYLYTCEITINKSYVIDAKGKDYSQFKHQLNDISDKVSIDKYDSIIIKNYKDSFEDEPTISTQYIIFDTKNIKIIDVTDLKK